LLVNETISPAPAKSDSPSQILLPFTDFPFGFL